MKPVKKDKEARKLIRKKTKAWFRDAPIDDRDRALINAQHVSFVEYGQASYLRKVYHLKRGQQTFNEHTWTVENDLICKSLVESAGATLVGFPTGPARPNEYASMTINVNIKCPAGGEFKWGFLSTQPGYIRIFKGPAITCKDHPWDAMILRDCCPNTDSMIGTTEISSHKWDILLMKMCEDFDYPWVVIAIKDSGPASDKPQHSCLDTDHCGCVFEAPCPPSQSTSTQLPAEGSADPMAVD
ncbi:hypothetical protein AB5N19_05156 [Seiridium cardinale]